MATQIYIFELLRWAIYYWPSYQIVISDPFQAWDIRVLIEYSGLSLAFDSRMCSKSHKLTRNIFEWLRWTYQFQFSVVYKDSAKNDGFKLTTWKVSTIVFLTVWKRMLKCPYFRPESTEHRLFGLWWTLTSDVFIIYKP